MHAATVLGLIGFLATFTGIINIGSWLSGNEVENVSAAFSKASMSIVSLVYFIFCLWSFISARLLKKDDQKEKPIEI